MRLIDADKLLMDIEHYNLSDGKFQHWVEIQPTAEPEQKKGKWNQIISIPNDMFGRFYCSECGKEGIPFWYFCPYCGADMREGEEE